MARVGKGLRPVNDQPMHQANDCGGDSFDVHQSDAPERNIWKQSKTDVGCAGGAG
jgi:hypothetical protein